MTQPQLHTERVHSQWYGGRSTGTNNGMCVHVVNCGDTDNDDRRLQLKLFAARHQNAFRDMYGVVYQNHSELLVRLLH